MGVGFLMSEACPGQHSYVGLLRVAGARATRRGGVEPRARTDDAPLNARGCWGPVGDGRYRKGGKGDEGAWRGRQPVEGAWGRGMGAGPCAGALCARGPTPCPSAGVHSPRPPHRPPPAPAPARSGRCSAPSGRASAMYLPFPPPSCCLTCMRGNTSAGLWCRLAAGARSFVPPRVGQYGRYEALV